MTMETLYNITKRMSNGKGEAMMWDTVKVVSDAIEHGMSERDRAALNAKIYGMLSGGHFDEDYAMESVSKMYYVDADGVKRSAPYWTIPQVTDIYESVKENIPECYNEWDFFVAFQMIASDSWMLLHKWWPNITQEQIAEKVTDLTVNWLSDEDNPFGDKKIWGYLHGGK